MLVKDFLKLLFDGGKNATFHISYIRKYEYVEKTTCSLSMLLKDYQNKHIYKIYNPGGEYTYEHYYMIVRD